MTDFQARNRSALIVATTNYSDTRLSELRSPHADASALAGVLSDSRIGCFEVATVLNQNSYQSRKSITKLFKTAEAEDFLLLYFSGHGVRDDDGMLYLTMEDTDCELLEATAISASFISDLMDRSLSRRQVLILDCCYSGAFSAGIKGDSDRSLDLGALFKGTGYGRAVLTSSNAVQVSLEGSAIVEEREASVFTFHLTEGLRTGVADLNEDGVIEIAELYKYVHEKVSAETRKQDPCLWVYEQQGNIPIALSNSLKGLSDWVYVYNFGAPEIPIIIEFPAGEGEVFVWRMKELMRDVVAALTAVFQCEEYQERRSVVDMSLEERQGQAVNDISERALRERVSLQRTPEGLTFVPLKNNKEVLTNEEFGLLDEEIQKEMKNKIEVFQDELQRVLRRFPVWQDEKREKIRELDRMVVALGTEPLFDEFREVYREQPRVIEYIYRVRDDIVEFHKLLLKEGTRSEQLQRYEAVVRGDYEHTRAWALAEKELGNIEKARRLFERVTRINPFDKKLWHAWEGMEEDQGETRRARALRRKRRLAERSSADEQ